jgi:hypothetical protein
LKQALHFCIYGFILLLLCGCIFRNSIDKHFEVKDIIGGSNAELIYTNDEDQMFTVIDGKVFAYQKCGNRLFVKQHPMNGQQEADLSTTNYYIVDLTKSYTEESAKPYDHTKELFESELKKNCVGSFIEP